MASYTRRKRRYVKGDPLYICDQSGFTYRRSDMVRQWDGLLVGKDQLDPRHPQEFVRGVPDDYAVRDARPRAPVNVLLGSTTLSGFASSPDTFVFDRDLELVRDRDGNVVMERGEIDYVGELAVVDLGSVQDVSFATIRFDELTNDGRDWLNIYYSQDGVEYTPADILAQEVIRTIPIGSDRNVSIGQRARYIKLGLKSVNPLAVSFTLSKFEVYGS